MAFSETHRNEHVVSYCIWLEKKKKKLFTGEIIDVQFFKSSNLRLLDGKNFTLYYWLGFKKKKLVVHTKFQLAKVSAILAKNFKRQLMYNAQS